MKIKIIFYYGFTGRVSFKSLFKKSNSLIEDHCSLVDEMKKAGVVFHTIDEEGFDFILGDFLREQNLNNNEIKQVKLTDYMFLLNQGQLKKNTDKIFLKVNEILEQKECYTFKEQTYNFLTVSLIE